MKTLLTIFILVLTVMFSSTSFADWTKVSESVDGDTYYVDFERIRKHDGYFYYWILTDYLKPDSDGVLSVKVYQQVDCALFRWKGLDVSFHNEPMGRGLGESFTPPDKWDYSPPNSTAEVVIKSVCAYAK